MSAPLNRQNVTVESSTPVELVETERPLRQAQGTEELPQNPPAKPIDIQIDEAQMQQDIAQIKQASLVTAEEIAQENNQGNAASNSAIPAKQEISQDWALFRLLGSALRPYKGWMATALSIMLIVAGLNVAPPYLLQQAIDGPLISGDIASLTWLALLYGGTAIGIFLLTYAYTYFLQQAGQRALADLRVRLFDHLLNHDYAFLSRTSTGELVARLTNDIDQLNAVLSSSVVVVLVEGATFIAVITTMLFLNWRLALIAMMILPVVGVVTVYFRKRIRRSSQGERTAMAHISSFLNEHLHGMTVVQLFNREEESEEEFEVFNSRYRRSLVILRHHSAVFLSVQEVLAAGRAHLSDVGNAASHPESIPAHPISIPRRQNSARERSLRLYRRRSRAAGRLPRNSSRTIGRHCRGHGRGQVEPCQSPGPPIRSPARRSQIG